MFRFICIVIFLILFLILTIPILIVEWIIGKFAPNARDISSLRIVQWGFKVILKITGVKTTVIGEENIPDEAVLFVGNHRSYFAQTSKFIVSAYVFSQTRCEDRWIF